MSDESKTGPWRCFHCGDLFTNSEHAADHFGTDEFAEPGCVAVLRHGEFHLLHRIQMLEKEVSRYQTEDSDLIRWAYAKDSQHRQDLIREEERGYAKGLRDGRTTPDSEE